MKHSNNKETQNRDMLRQDLSSDLASSHLKTKQAQRNICKHLAIQKWHPTVGEGLLYLKTKFVELWPRSAHCYAKYHLMSHPQRVFIKTKVIQNVQVS